MVLVDYAASCVEKKPDRYRLEPQRRGRLLPSSASPLCSAESKREKTPDRRTLDTERRGILEPTFLYWGSTAIKEPLPLLRAALLTPIKPTSFTAPLLYCEPG